MNDQLLSSIASYARKGELGRIKDGKHVNRIKCPVHGGDGYNAQVYEHGSIFCFSQCGYVNIRAMNELFGIQNRKPEAEFMIAPDDPSLGFDWSLFALTDKMARNHIEETVRDELSNYRIASESLYDRCYEAGFEALYTDWRDGHIVFEFGDIPSPAIRAEDGVIFQAFRKSF